MLILYVVPTAKLYLFKYGYLNVLILYNDEFYKDIVDLNSHSHWYDIKMK